MDRDFNITIAVPEDAEGINNIYYETWLATYPNETAGITAEDIEDSYKDRLSPERIQKARERLKNIPKNEIRLVAKIDGRVVGVARLIREETKNKLQTLYILPEFQGKGIGTALWAKGSKFLDPTKDTYLEVAEYNKKAISFYQNLGFKDTGRRLVDEHLRMKSGAIIPEIEMMRAAQ